MAAGALPIQAWLECVCIIVDCIMLSAEGFSGQSPNWTQMHTAFD